MDGGRKGEGEEEEMEKEEIVGEYERYLRMRGYKERGIEEKVRSSRVFLGYLEEKGMELTGFGPKEAEGYREHMSLMVNREHETRYHPKTINCSIAHLRNFFRYLESIGRVVNNPFASVERMKEGESLPKKILKIEEMGRVLESIEVNTKDDFEFKVVIEVLYSTGARISEIEKLRRGDIDVEGGMIILRDDKERRERRAPLTEYSKRMVQLYLDHLCDPNREKVFNHGKERSLGKWVNQRLKRLTAALGLPLISCHSIRHTVATHLFQKGADVREVQEYLGHRRIKNTEIYTRVLTEDLKKVIEECHPREKGGGEDEA